MAHARFHFYSKRGVSHCSRIAFKIITSNIMYQNAGTKLHEKAAALDVVYCTPSKLLVIFSKTTISKKYILKICQQSALNMSKSCL